MIPYITSFFEFITLTSFFWFYAQLAVLIIWAGISTIANDDSNEFAVVPSILIPIIAGIVLTRFEIPFDLVSILVSLGFYLLGGLAVALFFWYRETATFNDACSKIIHDHPGYDIKKVRDELWSYPKSKTEIDGDGNLYLLVPKDRVANWIFYWPLFSLKYIDTPARIVADVSARLFKSISLHNSVKINKQ